MSNFTCINGTWGGGYVPMIVEGKNKNEDMEFSTGNADTL